MNRPFARIPISFDPGGLSIPAGVPAPGVVVPDPGPGRPPPRVA